LGNKEIVKITLRKILSWDAERVIIAHGENMEEHVSNTLARAWKKVLSAWPEAPADHSVALRRLSIDAINEYIPNE
jgi:hypothetical protein